MCSNQASVPNSLPPLYMIDRFTSFRPASMDEILLKTAFCTENQCLGMPEQCPNVPGHARTMPEAPPHVPRACQNVPEPCPHAFQTTSGVVCTQVWTNHPRGRLPKKGDKAPPCLPNSSIQHHFTGTSTSTDALSIVKEYTSSTLSSMKSGVSSFILSSLVA